MVDQIAKMLRGRRILSVQLGRDPLPHELAADLGITEAEVHEMLSYNRDPVSLSTPIGEDGKTELGDLVSDDENADSAHTVLVYDNMVEELDKVLDTLTPREAYIIRARYGLAIGEKRTLGEVGRELGITCERVRQIEAKAFSRMRQRSTHLRDYLE
jgi:RNA polymerase primary sigma factor